VLCVMSNQKASPSPNWMLQSRIASEMLSNKAALVKDRKYRFRKYVCVCVCECERDL